MHRFDPAELPVHGCPTIKKLNKGPDNVVDVNQIHHHRRIVHLDRQSIGNIMTEGRHAGIVIWATPLAEHIRQTENMDRRTGCPAIGKDRILRPLFTDSVLVFKGCLCRGGDNYRLASPLHRQVCADLLCKPGVPGPELLGILWSVYTCQVVDKVRFFKQSFKGRGVVVYIETEKTDITSLLQGNSKIFTDESLGTSYEYSFHMTPKLCGLKLRVWSRESFLPPTPKPRPFRREGPAAHTQAFSTARPCRPHPAVQRYGSYNRAAP